MAKYQIEVASVALRRLASSGVYLHGNRLSSTWETPAITGRSLVYRSQITGGEAWVTPAISTYLTPIRGCRFIDGKIMSGSNAVCRNPFRVGGQSIRMTQGSDGRLRTVATAGLEDGIPLGFSSGGYWVAELSER